MDRVIDSITQIPFLLRGKTRWSSEVPLWNSSSTQGYSMKTMLLHVFHQNSYNLLAKSYHKLYNSVEKWFSIHIFSLQVVRNQTSKINFNGSSTPEKVIRKE